MRNIYIITGHYGSGKTEFSVNFALSLKKKHEKVMLVDLDIVNPYFRSHDAKALLEENGVSVLAPAYAGTNVDIPVLPPEIMRIFEEEDTQIVLDVGGDDDGAIALGRYKQFFDKTDYEMYLVVNTRRPLTQTKEEISEMKENIEIASRLSVTGLISDTNLADETTEDIVMEGVKIVSEVSSDCGLPMVYVCVPEGTVLPDVDPEKQFPIRRHLLKI